MTRFVVPIVAILLAGAGPALGQTLPMPTRAGTLVAPLPEGIPSGPDPGSPTPGAVGEAAPAPAVPAAPPADSQAAPMPAAPPAPPVGMPGFPACIPANPVAPAPNFAAIPPVGPDGRPWTGPAIASEPFPGEPVHPPRYRTWADLEFIFWWEKKQPVPPDLITTGSALDPRPGALGQLSTDTLFGPRGIGYGGLAGFRARAGSWLDGQELNGLEANGFLLESHRFATGFSSVPNGGPLLGLTTRDPATGAPGAFVIAAPNVPGGRVGPYSGTIVFSTRSHLWGTGADLLRSLYASSGLHLYASVGFRYLDLSEDVDINTQTIAIQTSATTFAPVSFLGSTFGIGSIPVLSVSSSSTTTNNTAMANGNSMANTGMTTNNSTATSGNSTATSSMTTGTTTTSNGTSMNGTNTTMNNSTTTMTTTMNNANPPTTNSTTMTTNTTTANNTTMATNSAATTNMTTANHTTTANNSTAAMNMMTGSNTASTTNTATANNMTTTNNTATTNNVPAPASVQTADRFETHNRFYGGQLGLRGEYVYDRWFLGVSGTLGLGETQTIVDIFGVSTLKNPFSLAQQRAPGGLYALPSNSGRFFSQDFAVIPEFQVKGGVLVTPWFRATVGYDFLYWSRVLRPGDQIDLNIDSRQVPTSPSFHAGSGAVYPRPLMNHTGFWAQGVTVALEFAY